MFEEEFPMKICIHNVDMEMFVLHELILYVFEDYVSILFCIHMNRFNVIMKTAFGCCFVFTLGTCKYLAFMN